MNDFYTFQFASLVGMDDAMKTIHQEAVWNREKDQLIRYDDLKGHMIYFDNILILLILLVFF